MLSILVALLIASFATVSIARNTSANKATSIAANHYTLVCDDTVVAHPGLLCYYCYEPFLSLEYRDMVYKCQELVIQLNGGIFDKLFAHSRLQKQALEQVGKGKGKDKGKDKGIDGGKDFGNGKDKDKGSKKGYINTTVFEKGKEKDKGKDLGKDFAKGKAKSKDMSDEGVAQVLPDAAQGPSSNGEEEEVHVFSMLSMVWAAMVKEKSMIVHGAQRQEILLPVVGLAQWREGLRRLRQRTGKRRR